jgi:hypothetical protein
VRRVREPDALPGAAAGADVLDCRPLYLRYKPAQSCVVLYSLTVRERGGEVDRGGGMNGHGRSLRHGRPATVPTGVRHPSRVCPASG